MVLHCSYVAIQRRFLILIWRIQIQKQKEAHVVANAVYSDLCEDLCLQRKCIKIFAIAAGVIPGILLAAPMENGLTACSFSCASFDNPYTSE